ncbi:diaminopimelate decarboxylase [Achlya hypogyna]|uniref:Diaminopimelate decarboxylase n=1 Tax=Achlya hypogyna TaxID=1202772 RepID=A0A1V9Z4V5_ACHHY|nr:diaminopimelate decarboxylase [Achlya hypogyna]
MDALRSADLAALAATCSNPEDAGPSALADAVCKRLGLDPSQSVQSLLENYFRELPPDTLKDPKGAMATPEMAVDDEEVGRHEARAAGVAAIIEHIVQRGYISTANPVMDLFDVDMFTARLEELRDAFPAFWTHALAIKANPLSAILLEAKPLGFGLETASYAEAMHAVHLGFPPEKIIIDSPCKTFDELAHVLRLGCYVNLDNVAEIDKVNSVLDTMERPTAAKIGLRINPAVGGGTIAASSTATSTSKFGLIWTPETSEHLVDLFRKHPWLQGVHVHVGSQGCPLQLLVAGAKRAVEFATMVNTALGRRQIVVIDIGGGVPTIYDGLRTEAVAFATYASLLRAQVPDLFTGDFRVVTEFGRSVFAKPGVTVTKVEAVKDWAGHRVAVVHCGANQLLRSVYLPSTWPLTFSAFDALGRAKQGPLVPQDLAGPLCFSGDVVQRRALLPLLTAGDIVVVHDTGAYNMAMYSKFNSIPAPATLAYRGQQVAVVKPRETIDETLAFWGAPSAKLVWAPDGTV